MSITSAPIDDWQYFDRRVEELCQLYGLASKLSEQNKIEVYSADEKYGMQALERAAPDLPATKGQVRRRECNYIDMTPDYRKSFYRRH